MMKSARTALTALALTFHLGCGDISSAPNSPKGGIPARSGFDWFGVPSLVGFVIEKVHDGTGWVLDKNQVSISKIGDVRGTEPNCYVADFKIVVTKNSNSFDTTAKNIPCDSYGIPTHESVAKIGAAVEDIKAKIKRFQK